MKRAFVKILMVCLLIVLISPTTKTHAAGQYPVKPLIGLCPVEPGSDGDLTWRGPCQKASTILGQPIVVVNKPGAGGSLCYRELYTAKPDGYTVCQITSSLIVNKLQGILPYNFEDYTILGTLSQLNGVIIGSTKTKRPFKNIKEALSFAQSNPGEVSIAVGSVGSSLWIFAMAFIEGTGLKFNIIPQAGSGGYITTQVAGGHTDLGILLMPSVKSQLDAGNVRLLGVMGEKRLSPPFDNVPTLREVGYDLVAETFGAVAGPPKMPRDITAKLIKAFEVASTDPEYHKFLRERSMEPFYLSPDQAIKYMDNIRTSTRKIMDKAGVLKEK
jgi:tripartite-type tricarboxylate transporter receptor subunit TctC